MRRAPFGVPEKNRINTINHEVIGFRIINEIQLKGYFFIEIFRLH